MRVLTHQGVDIHVDDTGKFYADVEGQRLTAQSAETLKKKIDRAIQGEVEFTPFITYLDDYRGIAKTTVTSIRRRKESTWTGSSNAYSYHFRTSSGHKLEGRINRPTVQDEIEIDALLEKVEEAKKAVQSWQQAVRARIRQCEAVAARSYFEKAEKKGDPAE